MDLHGCMRYDLIYMDGIRYDLMPFIWIYMDL